MTANRSRAVFAGAIALGTAAALPLALTDRDAVRVLAPIFASLLTLSVFYWALSRRRLGHMPWFEIGVVYSGVVALYLVYPLVGFLAIGQQYTPYSDIRLFRAQPSAQEVAAIAWLYVWHLLGFVLAYLGVRGRLPISGGTEDWPGPALFISIVCVYMVIEMFGVVVGFFYDIHATTYAETYLVSRRLPLILAQLLNHLDGIRYALAVMLMGALFTRYPASRIVIGGWLLIVAAATVVRLGSRTEFVLLALSAAMLYHMKVRPLPSKLVLCVGLAGIVCVIGFGIVRNAAAGGRTPSYNPFVYPSEFENLFANAVHLAQVKRDIGPLPASFYLSDFAALIPQQIAPFTKVNPADWYVATYFPAYAAMGGGLAFGTIAEAVLLGGWLGALIRGVLLGCLFAGIHRAYARRPGSFWTLVFYVWIATLSYQCFRNTTLYLLVLCAFRFLPALIAVNLMATLLKRVASAAPRVAPGLGGAGAA